jgi:nucleoside phosphorylase
MLDPEEYTVGWICAIETEYTAAQTFFDNEHGPPGHVSYYDTNHYTLGDIKGHNVVMAVLPDGEYGTSSAASVIANMLIGFPNIKVGLMVGIGGGAPTEKEDIRLGDIVVSSPKEGSSGVYQYDFGKTVQGSAFVQTGFLNQPSSVVRSAVTGLRSKYRREGHNIEGTIESILEAWPRLKKDFSRPALESDRLYVSTFVHTSNVACDESCATQLDKIVTRQPRQAIDDNPHVHHGIIASGNQLMKDALIRDHYAKEKHILCFEMEAAGIMNQYPCLIIRGICDYSDSHKSKDWQGYAAMVAAAYAKDLLGEIQKTRKAHIITTEIETDGNVRNRTKLALSMQSDESNRTEGGGSSETYKPAYNSGRFEPTSREFGDSVPPRGTQSFTADGGHNRISGLKSVDEGNSVGDRNSYTTTEGILLETAQPQRNTESQDQLHTRKPLGHYRNDITETASAAAGSLELDHALQSTPMDPVMTSMLTNTVPALSKGLFTLLHHARHKDRMLEGLEHDLVSFKTIIDCIGETMTAKDFRRMIGEEDNSVFLAVNDAFKDCLDLVDELSQLVDKSRSKPTSKIRLVDIRYRIGDRAGLQRKIVDSTKNLQLALQVITL